MSLGPLEIALIVGVILLLFGARKLPELARSLGRAKNEFSQGLKDGQAPEAQDPPRPPETVTRAADTTPEKTDRQ